MAAGQGSGDGGNGRQQGGREPGSQPTGAKVNCTPRDPGPRRNEPAADGPPASPCTCPGAAAKAAPARALRSGARAEMLAQETWLSGASELRAPGAGGTRPPAWGGGRGELERPGGRQVQRVPAAPRRGHFLAFSFLPFPPSFRLPSSSFPPSLLPPFLTPFPSPLPAVTSKPKDKTVTCAPRSGPEVRLGHCRSPGARSVTARLIPARLSGPAAAAPFMGLAGSRLGQGVPSPLGRQRRQCALFTLRAAAGTPLHAPRECATACPPPSTGPWTGVGVGDNYGFQGTH